MKIFSVVLSMLRPVRFLIVAFTCALLFLSSTVPAFAISSYQSEPTEATDQLLETQKATDEVARSAPPGLKEVQKKSNEGLNEVQGAADIDKQKRPANSQDSTSVEGEIQNLLEKVTGKK
ncbi:conserved hypothetical low temperature-induced protein [Trichormus variabilis ATCC 29413]|uniref:Low temperature-induced protein n=2 Tax=Anabaena variabilis TaxID=264691 RepID=A0ABR6SDH5_ANAVA|nr:MULTISPECIES: hypothetical protein [Nostocaceae]ABA22486.1 conserved hypothetical low temperature-induced protein [Trichormus variabilis ATCC 29413]MBC1215980.1 hypothetical protein [Trichormus variabilis ARAD]MBC1258804.1 hypothetical protein [Trichormus variabilis V5]MBC1267998.1 hypothetical protein [Trichormus variabilis FSR]MBC1304455.1 hypothetical protein [Trichormus variabilis N2B]